jgi:DNA replication initiation complex subunit (GINS family)
MEKDVIITYETLYEILRREKARPDLQKLDETFFKDVLNYISEKKSILDSQLKKDSIFGTSEIEKTKKQIENINKILKELYEKREYKILQSALIGSRAGADFNNMSLMLPEEKALYEELYSTLLFGRNSILTNLINGKLPERMEKSSELKPKDINMASKGEDNKLIRMISPLPKFMGPNLEIYGPFDQENTVNLPSDIANLLIKNKKAEEIKV